MMAYSQAMALRSPTLHLACLAPRITSAILQSTSAHHQPKWSRTVKCFSVRAQRDEQVEAAKAAAGGRRDDGAATIFDKIVSREIPATVVYETEKVLAFRDINPQAPVHVVLVPKRRDGLTQLSKASEGNKDVLGELLLAAKVVADQEGLVNGFRVVINDGPDGCQSVYHLHLHLMGGRQLKWPPG